MEDETVNRRWHQNITNPNFLFRRVFLMILSHFRNSNNELLHDLDDWLHDYNYERTHQGKMCCGRTPIQTLIDGKEAWHDKIATLNN